MSISEVLESMDRAGSDARRIADEEAEIRAALRAEAARAGSQRALAEEWGVSEQFLGKVINGSRRPTAAIRGRLGSGAPAPGPGKGRVRGGRRSARRDVQLVAPAPRAEAVRPAREWPYRLRPVVLNIFATEKGLRRWVSESAPAQIREREAAMAGGASSDG